jgi:LysM repeat protein
MVDEPRRSSRRCPSCGSSLEAASGRCSVCGERAWRFPRQGILVESGLVVAAVLVLVGGLLWLRQRGAAPAREDVLRVEALVDQQPTDMPTFTAAAPATETAVPNTPFPATATPLPETITHVVKSGDTLYGIAIEYGVSLDTIVTSNQLPNSHSLSIGQELLIPVNPSSAQAAIEPPADEASGGEAVPEIALDEDEGEGDTAAFAQAEVLTVRDAVVYRVQPGDTLLGIAITHDTPIETLRERNGFGKDDPELSIGQEILIRPAEEATTTPPPAQATVPSTLAEADRPVVAEDAGTTLYPAPRLLSPGNGQFVGEEAPLLRWASVGVLADDVYYVVSLRDVSAPAGAALPDSVSQSDTVDSIGATALGQRGDAEDSEFYWILSNATALRLPPSFRPAFGSTRSLEWTVTVRRRSASLIGKSAGEVLSTARNAQVWTFTWAPGAQPEADATE